MTTDFFSCIVDGKLSLLVPLGGLELQDLMLEIEERLRMERNLNAIFYVFSCTIQAVKTCLVFTVKRIKFFTSSICLFTKSFKGGIRGEQGAKLKNDI